MSNYPDDIRSYDNDPRSPFCDEWACPECGGNEYDVRCQPELCEEWYCFDCENHKDDCECEGEENEL